MVGYGIFIIFIQKKKTEKQLLYFYSFTKQCEFVILKNKLSGFIQEERDAAKLEMGKHFIRSDVTVSATVA